MNGEVQQISEAFVSTVDLVRQGSEVSHRGNGTAEKVELARGMIREASQRWPGLPEYLERTGLGSDPKLIQQLAARAERRPRLR
jgi:hypothetical protein